MTETADVIVIGAGIAGASVAAALSATAKVTILEMEERPGYHTTGRSAAALVPQYGPPVIRALTLASVPFLECAPEDFADVPLVEPRGMMMVAIPGDEQLVEEGLQSGLQQISLIEARKRVPPLDLSRLSAALIDDTVRDIDVGALHQGYLKTARRNNASLVCNAEVFELKHETGIWTARTPPGDVAAPIVVNAAGAWADRIAGLAGLPQLGISPKRRSAAIVPPMPDWNVSAWPLVFGAGETFYFKPMGGKLMVSPADETPVEPHDAWADDMLLAEAIEQFGMLLSHEVTRVEYTWGGLRTFASDGNPIIGFDASAEGFFWLAGQGGYGIQTSPAISRLAAALIAGTAPPAELILPENSIDDVSPARFAS